jgi:hypothetical protein
VSATLNYTETLTVVHCTCGIAFAIPAELDRQMHERGKSVHCPLGHSWHYTKTLEAELADAKRRLSATRELLQAEERSHASTRGHLTRARQRAKAGVCPCCHRTFENVARHMATKHPDWHPDSKPEAT